MPGIEALVHAVASSAPLRIVRFEHEGDDFQVGGEGSNVNTLGVWRAVEGRRVAFACYDDERGRSEVRSLIGLSITAARAQSHRAPVDPAFVLSDGRVLEIFSTDTFEPWTLHFPGGEILIPDPGAEDLF